MAKRRTTVARIENDQCRMVSFSKRRAGLFKKVKELSALTGAHAAVLVVSQAGRPSAEATPSVASVVDQFFSLSGNAAAAIPDDAGGEASVVSSPNDNFEGSLSALLNAEVDGCERVEELWALKSNLEEMRQRVTMALDLHFANSCLNLEC